MKDIRKVIIIAICFIILLTTTVFAYFQFKGEEDVKISLSVRVPGAFGKLPDTQLPTDYAGDPDETWGEHPDNPFLINIPQHLKNLEILNNMGELDDKYYYRLDPMENDPVSGLPTLNMDGLDMSPIGTEEFPFKGEFDGRGNVISEMAVSANNGEIDIGMFGLIGEDAYVGNLIISGFKIKSIANAVPISLLTHETEKIGTNAEDCHIGILCGHLDGEIENISVYNADIEIDSSGLDYYSKFGIIGFFGALAKVQGDYISDTQLPTPLDGDFGYWYADHIYEFTGLQSYIDLGNTPKTIDYGYLTGNAAGNTPTVGANSNSAGVARRVGSTIEFAAGKALPSYGIFNLHTTDFGFGNSSCAVINALTSGTDSSKLRYVRAGQAMTTSIEVDLNASYDKYSTSQDERDQYKLQQNIYDPWKDQNIKSFSYGILLPRGVTGTAARVVDTYTGLDATGTQPTTAGIHFAVEKPCRIFVVAQAATSNQVNLCDIKSNGNYNAVVTGRTIPSGDNRLYAIEFDITQTMINNTMQTTVDGKQKGNFTIGVDAANSARIVYLAVPGGDQGDHENTQKYKRLPTVDYIYDLAWPVTRAGFLPSDIIPFFTMGSKNNSRIIEQLKVEYRRSGMHPNSVTFTMNASGRDANRPDFTLVNPMFDYVRGENSNDTVNLVRSP